MLDKKIIILNKKISVYDLQKCIAENSNKSNPPIIMENRMTVSIYNIIPLAILLTFQHKKIGGSSRWEIFSMIYNKLNELYSKLDPYKDKGIWGLFFDELQINYIIFYPKLKKLNVSVS